MEISIQKEIDLVNEIIRTAINHGGDQGGAYYTNWDCLQTAIGSGFTQEGWLMPILRPMMLPVLFP